MKQLLSILLALLLFSGCSALAAQPATAEPPPTQTADSAPAIIPETTEIPYESRFKQETLIRLSDTGMDVSGPDSLSVFGSNDIIYYEDRDTYDSGRPYGEGTDADKHTAAEAEKHYVVNITAPGTYRVTGKLSAGQIRVDLGEDAKKDASAVVELILDNADITCTVAPAILFLNVYECDAGRNEENATPEVDTSHAGANLILEGKNTVNGSYVAKIFKDKKDEKKLWKQDGAIYSYMSMNIYGPGALTLNAANEGLGTEMHLTVNGGDLTILSQNDGINTNEDNLSVTTINAGDLHIVAGLGEEGDGIDSNGYLVINGGHVISAAKPHSDSGLDSDCGSFIHGGTVVALGAAMDWAESDSNQVTMNLQFSQRQTGLLQITAEDGTEVFSFDPAYDPVLKDYDRGYQGAVISCSAFQVGASYHVYSAGTQMAYSSTDVMRHPGGFGGKGQRPEGFDGQMPSLPEGEMPTWPEGEAPARPDGNRGNKTNRIPEGEPPAGWNPGDKRNPEAMQPTAPGQTRFYMQDKVNFFSGLSQAQ